MKFGALIGGGIVLLTLSGCAGATSAGGPISGPTPQTPPPTSEPSATPTAPSFVPVDAAAYDLPWLGAHDGVAFNSPDNNIACGISEDTPIGDYYGCAIGAHAYVEPPSPAAAVDPCGGGFWGSTGAPPVILCSGEPATFAGQSGGAAGVKVLPLGASITFNAVTCSSAADGITCRTLDGHGFRISAPSYSLY